MGDLEGGTVEGWEDCMYMTRRHYTWTRIASGCSCMERNEGNERVVRERKKEGKRARLDGVSRLRSL